MQDGDFELITLKNGARAVRHTGHGEVMHPAEGPWVEAQRLYVEQTRIARRLLAEGPPLIIHDVGLGAGTNAVAVLTAAMQLGAQRKRAIHIISFEVDLAPLRLALADEAGFPFLKPFHAAAHALMKHGTYSSAGVTWELKMGNALDVPDASLPPADVILFDPFSPAANPGMWTVEAFTRMRNRSRDQGEGTLLVTYSAATPTRVTLLLAGWFVGAGWSTGLKRETTAASTVLASLEAPLGPRWMERWERSSARGPHGQPFDEGVVRAIQGHSQFSRMQGTP